MAEVVVASGELVESVVGRDVNVGIAERQVGVDNIRRGDGEPEHRMISRRDTALLHATPACAAHFSAESHAWLVVDVAGTRRYYGRGSRSCSANSHTCFSPPQPHGGRQAVIRNRRRPKISRLWPGAVPPPMRSSCEACVEPGVTTYGHTRGRGAG